jgi:hypothetical protein
MSHKFMPFNPEALPKADAEFAAIDNPAKSKKSSPKSRMEIEEQNIEDAWRKKVGEPAKDFEAKARFVDYDPKTYEEISKKNNSSAEAHLGEEIPEAPGPGENRTELDDKKIEDAWREKVGIGESSGKPHVNRMAEGWKEFKAGKDNTGKINEILTKEGIPTGESREDTLKRLDEAIANARNNYAKKDYEVTNILARIKNVLNLRTRPGNLQETHDLYNQYQICVNDRLQFEMEELKGKNLTPEEFKVEAEKIAKYYNQDEKANLYGAHTDARAKVWEEKFGKKPKWIAEKSGKLINRYRKVNWKIKMGVGIIAGLSGAGFLVAGQRILGGAAAGVGVHGFLEGRYRGKEEERLQGERGEMLKNVEGIEGQEKKCEALMQMLQNEVGGFQKDLQMERKGARNRKLLGATAGALLGSGKLQEFVRWGLSETNAGEHIKSAWIGLVGQKFADQVSEKFGEIGKVLKGSYNSVKNSEFVQKIPGMAKETADSFKKHFAAGIGEGEAVGGAGHIEPVGKISNLGTENTLPGGGVPNNPDFPNDTFHADKALRPPLSNGMTQFEEDVRASRLAKGGGMTQFEKDIRDSDLGKGKISGLHAEPVGKVSNIGMEQNLDHAESVAKASNKGAMDKILEIRKGSSIENTMIKNGADPGEAHRMVLKYAKEHGIPANKLDLVHPGAKLVLSPDGKSIVSFEDSQPSVSKAQVNEQKIGRHAARQSAEHVEKVEAVKPSSPEVDQHQLEEIRNIETENNSLVANNAELQQKLDRLNAQIEYDKQSLALGKDYPGQIRSGPSLRDSMNGRISSRDVLQNQIEANNARIGALQEEYAEKFGSGKTASPHQENVPKGQSSPAELKNQDALLQEKVETVKTVRQEIAGGKVEEWNRIKDQPAQVILKQPDSTVTNYYNVIVQENPRYVRYIRPRRYESIIDWTIRLGDYHHHHHGRFMNFHIPHRRHW